MPASLARHVVGLVRRTRNRLLNLVDPAVYVLIYHRVTTLPEDPQQLAVSPENFRAQMRFLKSHFPILRFDEDWSRNKTPSIVVTFDDGYRDNLTEALPILEAEGVPATFFVSTDNLGTDQEYWWDDLERILRGPGPFPESFALDDWRFGQSMPVHSPEQREQLYQRLLPLMKPLPPADRTEWLAALQHWANAGKSGREAYLALNEAELRQLAASPWTNIGAHTLSHCRLSSLSPEEQQVEIHSSKQRLEELLGQEVATFSYPYGRKEDYDRNSIEICRAAGFRKAAANFPGQVHRWTDPFQLPRHLVRNWDLETFVAELKIKGIWPA